ncbi:MAG: adenylyltransferase/cytidyltransferase family protein [Candidatus Delongbacteria bacterium]|nr:adenylyltransferase/cytidyltransferase family protein [Candidatus Delongbacteria bacterium]
MILSELELLKIISELRESGKRIVFTNGVFDILHRGHAEYLNSAKKLGEILIVGVNSDLSVKRLKGDGRPVNSEGDRAYLIDSLKAVDYTVVFQSDTPLGLIETIVPDILIKGGDYDPDETDPSNKKYIVGSDIVKMNGGSVSVIPLVPFRSTTLTLKKIQDIT